VAERQRISGFLSLLGPAERTAVAAIGRRRTYPRGDRLFLEGDPSDAVYLVLEGRARVLTTTAEGNEVTLSVRGPGDLIGEMSALDPGSLRSASVVALDPLRCQVIPSTELLAFLDAHPRTALALLRLTIGRLREADRRRTEFGSYDATRRLARVLVETADEVDSAATAGTPARLGDLALSQRELAGLIGASRESVARALAELRRRGLIATGRRAITIRDPAALRLYAS
jgi:CRP/FNR family transcriptional regulator, cyclic AMP receptor protein